MTNRSSSSFLDLPATRLGWWAVGLGIAFVVMSISNTIIFMPSVGPSWWSQTILPYFGILMMLCGFAAGIVGLVAVLRNRDHSWLVWLTILPGTFVLFFVVGGLFAPH
jgi:hypothetical protein